jgi:hypothetical protein
LRTTATAITSAVSALHIAVAIGGVADDDAT